MKICNQCGGKVEDKSNFCPYCKSNSFRPTGEVMVPEKGGIAGVKYKLFYWDYDGRYVLSKSKLVSISVFLVFLLTAIGSQAAAGMIALGVIFALIVLLLGFSIHKLLGHETRPEILLKYNDYGLIADLKYLLFYWQNKTNGAYAFSKTKSITVLIFLLVAVMICMFSPPNFFAIVLAGLVVAVPSFAIGSAIHKLTNPNPEGEIVQKKIPNKPKPQIKRQKPKVIEKTPQNTEKYGGYKSQLEDLRNEFDSKDKNVRKLIEQRFEPPQLTYTRFIAVVDKSQELFNREYESSMNLIELADENSPRIEAELKSKVDVLKSIIQKIDDLSDELVLTMDSPDNSEVDGLIDDMEDLIKSVRDYS